MPRRHGEYDRNTVSSSLGRSQPQEWWFPTDTHNESVNYQNPTTLPKPRELIELHRALATVRESYPARQWSKALAAYLHDRDLQGQGQTWFGKGRSEFERGE